MLLVSVSLFVSVHLVIIHQLLSPPLNKLIVNAYYHEEISHIGQCWC